MNAAGLISVLLLAAGFIYTWRNRAVDDNCGDPFESAFLLEPNITGLIDVTDDMTLLTPRGVELEISPVWDFDDVMQTLVDIDRLGATP